MFLYAHLSLLSFRVIMKILGHNHVMYSLHLLQNLIELILCIFPYPLKSKRKKEGRKKCNGNGHTVSNVRLTTLD